MVLNPVHKALPHFDVDAVAPGGAGLDLLLQFKQLRLAGTHAQALEPMAQHIGLACWAQALQGQQTPELIPQLLQ